MSKVLCFGEILLRFSPAKSRIDFKNTSIPIFIGGAELNVAHALAKWDVSSAYCSAMPKNFISDDILDYLKSKNIDSSPIHFSGNRIGIYYLSQGADVKSSGIIFDRANSAFSELQLGMIDWKTIFKDVSWFHFSAIAASLTMSASDVCLEALQVASAMGVTISLDLNYRDKLWKYEYAPLDIMPRLAKYCNVIMGNMWSVEKLLGISSPIASSEGKTVDELRTASQESIAALKSTYPNLSTVAYTLRLGDSYSAVWSGDSETTFSKEHHIADAIDRVGSGDCFMGGVIYSTLNKFTAQDAIDFCAAAAVGKLYEKGDVTNKTVEEVKALIA